MEKAENQRVEIPMADIKNVIDGVLDDSEWGEKINNSIDEMNTIKGEIDDKVVEINGMQTQIEGKVEEINGMQTEINNKVEEMNTIQTEVNKKVEEMGETQKQVNEKVQEMDGIKTEIEGKVEEINGMQTEIGNKVQEMDGIKEDINKKVEEMDGIKGEIDDKVQKLDNIHTLFGYSAEKQRSFNLAPTSPFPVSKFKLYGESRQEVIESVTVELKDALDEVKEEYGFIGSVLAMEDVATYSTGLKKGGYINDITNIKVGDIIYIETDSSICYWGANVKVTHPIGYYKILDISGKTDTYIKLGNTEYPNGKIEYLGESYPITTEAKPSPTNPSSIEVPGLVCRGRQLLNPDNWTYGNQGTVTVTEDGRVVSVSGSVAWSQGRYKLSCKGNETYYVYIDGFVSTSTASYMTVAFFDSSETQISTQSINKTGKTTIITPSNATSFTFYIMTNYSTAPSTTQTATVTGLIVSKEPVDHWEPFSSGINQLEVTATSQTINGVTFTVNKDNSITVNGTNSASYSASLYLNQTEKVLMENICVVYNLSTNVYATVGINGASRYLNGTGKIYIEKGNTINYSFVYVQPNGTASNEKATLMFTKPEYASYPYSPYVAGGGNIAKYNKIEAKAEGKNLINPANLVIGYALNTDNGETFVNNNRTTASFIPVVPKTTYILFRYNRDIQFGGLLYYDEYKKYLNVDYNKWHTEPLIFTVPENAHYLSFALKTNNDNYVPVESAQIQLEIGDTTTEYTPYQTPSTASLSTINGLPGIKVPDDYEDYTYMDEDGQKWVADTIEYEDDKAKYVKRLEKATVNVVSVDPYSVTSNTDLVNKYGKYGVVGVITSSGAASLTYYDQNIQTSVDNETGNKSFFVSTGKMVFCGNTVDSTEESVGWYKCIKEWDSKELNTLNGFIWDYTQYAYDHPDDEQYQGYFEYIGKTLQFTDPEITTPYLSTTGELSDGAEVYYVLDEPVTTAMDNGTTESLQQFHTLEDTTLMSNSADCMMDVEYTYDTRTKAEKRYESRVQESDFDKVVYSFHINGNEPNPADMVTYEGSTRDMIPGAMNYSSGVFNYGSWGNAFFMPRPVMLYTNCRVAYELDIRDVAKKKDGTASDVANADFDGNAMMEWGNNGRIFWKMVADAGDPFSGRFYVANYKPDDSFHDWNYHERGNRFYTSIYPGSLIDGRMRSLSGQDYTKQIRNYTAEQERAYAKANGKYYDIGQWVDWVLIACLGILVSKTTDSQTAFGKGQSAESWTESLLLTTGTMDKKGLMWGENTGKSNGMKFFGMENWYGNTWKRCVGLINDKGTVKVKMTKDRRDGSTVDDYNLTGDGYIAIPNSTPGGTNGGYINKMLFSQYGFSPKTISGSSTTYYTDGGWFNNSQVNVAFLGGSLADGLLCGSLTVRLSVAASDRNWVCAAPLSCKPPAL